MAFDQTINYRVNVDDSNFQAKLSQMRASMDMMVGGLGSPGFGAGMSGAQFGAMMAPYSGGYTGGMMGGLADFGSQVRPVTYTPPAIAMQPHFGMVALQQTTGQAMMGAMGPLGIGAQSTGRFMRHPLSGAPADVVPLQMSYGEYSALSARAFGGRAGDAAATAAYVATDVGANLIGGMVGGAIGSAVGGPIGGFVGSVLGGYGVDKLMGPVGTMMATNRAVQTQLEAGSFRFISGGPDVDPLTGRGFGRKARAEAADFVQSTELHDVRFGMGEMRQVLEGGMQMDLFSGTKDVDDFKGKFKGLVEAVKTVTATLHTSLKDGIEVIRGMRDIGVTDPNQIVGLTMKAETMGRMSGRTGSEMFAIGQAGAEIFRGTGINMQLGFETNMQNTTLVRQLLNQNLLSRESIMQAGGENAMGQQMTAAALGSMQTPIGRGLLMANFDAANMGLNPNMGANMIAKGGIIGELSRAAAMTPGQIIQFQAHQEDLISKMSPMQMQLFSLQSGMMEAREVKGAVGGDIESNLIQAMRRQNPSMPIDVIRAQVAMLKADPNALKQGQQAAEVSMTQQAAIEDVRNTYGFKKVTNFLGRTLVQPIQQTFTSISTATGEAVDNLGIRLMGGTVADANRFLDASTILNAKQLAQNPFVAAPGSAAGEVVDLRASLYSKLVGGQSGAGAAEAIFGADTNPGKIGAISFMGGSAMKFKSEADVKAYAEREHTSMKILGDKDGTILAVSQQEEEKMLKRRMELVATSKDKEAAEKFHVSGGMGTTLEQLSLREAQGKGQVSLRELTNTLIKDKSFANLSVAAQGEVLAKTADQMGFKLASKQVEGAKGKALADAGIASSAADIKKGISAGEANRSLFADIANTVATSTKNNAGAIAAKSAINKLQMDDQNELTLVALDPTSPQGLAAAEHLRGKVSADVIRFAQTDLHKSVLDKGQMELVAGRLKQSKASVAAGLISAEETGMSVTGAGTIGELSKDTVSQMRDMSTQLVKNMEMLVALQKQFNQLQGSR